MLRILFIMSPIYTLGLFLLLDLTKIAPLRFNEPANAAFYFYLFASFDINLAYPSHSQHYAVPRPSLSSCSF